MEDGKNFVFSDFDYVEVVLQHSRRDPDSVALGTDPYILIRPEGLQWPRCPWNSQQRAR